MPLLVKNEIKNGGIPVLSLLDYLSQNRTLIIPPWQREYSWKTTEDEQVDTLLKDLKKFLQNDSQTEYLMGSVVLCTQPENKNRPLLIDGQQRTLTLTLLLMCCQKFLKSNNQITQDMKDTALDSAITSTVNSNPFGVFQARVEMKQEDADATLRELYNWSIIAGDFDRSVFKNMDKKTLTQKNLISATEYIYKKIAGEEKRNKKGEVTSKIAGEWLDPEELKVKMSKLLNNVKFIQIEVDDKRESISVFDHINNRGMALNPADLVKNLMFENVPNDEFETISESWNSMTSSLMLTKKSRLQDPRYLLRAISHVEYGAHESYENLDVFWSEKFDLNAKNSEKGISPIDFSKLLPDYAENLRSLALRDREFKHPLSEIYLSGELGSVQHYSVLLAGCGIINKDVFQLLCKQVNYRTLLYMFSGERTQAFDLMIPGWAKAVKEKGSNATKQDLYDVYREKALPDEKVFADLKEQMALWNYTNATSKKRIRSVLALLSVYLNDICGVPVRIEDAMRTVKVKTESHPWEIDHIMAQANSKEEKYQTIGNLVLLSSSDNNNASNDIPNEKIAIYKESALVLTKTLAGLDFANSKHAKVVTDLLSELQVDAAKWQLRDWNDKSVDNRFEFYYLLLRHVFKSVEK